MADDPARIVELRESRQRLWDLAAATLTDSQWTSLWLFYVEEMSLNEIAKVLNSSSTAVKARLHRARRKLANELESDGTAHDMKPAWMSEEIYPTSRLRTGTGDD